MTSGKVLRDGVAGKGLLHIMATHSPLSARLAEEAGFDGLWASGFELSALYGLPDMSLVTMSQHLEMLRCITGRSSLPVIADIDTGFGNALNVMRTVKVMAGRGASAIQLEDQTTPKRCGHLADKRLIPTAEMVGKLRAALDARPSAETLIIARTDAIAVEGFAAALDRAEAYREAGADMLFIEAPRSDAELAEICARFRGRAPLMANMVEGGRTPPKEAKELEALGFSLVIFPGGTVRALAHALQGYFASLHQHGSTKPWRDRMLDFNGLNEMIGTPEMLALGRRYDEEAMPGKPEKADA